jgi:GDPmannose 4,6-dehydratase
MWRMLQQKKPDDFVLATGETHSVREFVELAFRQLDMELEWTGHGVHEKGREKKTGRTLVEVAPRYYRPTEVDILTGDATKAKQQLKWLPVTTFQDLVTMMAQADYEKVSRRGY